MDEGEEKTASVQDAGGKEEDAGEKEEETEPLADQLAQLQGMVKEMKDGFVMAMEALSEVQYGDQILQEKVQNNQEDYDKQLADVVQMVLTLKSEFSGLASKLDAANEGQKNLKQQVETLQFERDILLEELERAGVISEQVKQKYHSGQTRPNGLVRTNESPLSVLLERARNVFHGQNGASDQDSGVTNCQPGDTSSCGEVTPPQGVSPLVRSYIAGLPNGNQDEGLPAEEDYDSDSSLTAAANRSLDLSRSLGDRCTEITQADSSDEEEEEVQSSKEEQVTPPIRSPGEAFASTPFPRTESPKKTPPHERNTKELFRLRVAGEILETERKYCSNLWVILDNFMAPLKNLGLASNKEISVMFPSYLCRIYDYHCGFLQKLEERLSNWKWQGVLGDIFCRFFDTESDLLKQYQWYLNEFPGALHQIRKSCRYSTKFRKFLRKSQQNPCCEGLDVTAFLLTPVQRIPRYVLLLKQLLKQTDTDHPDYYYIEASLQKLGTFLQQLNDSIEYSLKVVASDTTPKPKRKLRVPSMQSSSSSCDAMQLSSATRDSGITNCDNSSVFSSASGRMFQLSVFKDRRGQVQPMENGLPLSDVEYGRLTPSSQAHSDALSFSTAPPHQRDQTFGGYESRTLPAVRREKKHRWRQPRPVSGDIPIYQNISSQNLTNGYDHLSQSQGPGLYDGQASLPNRKIGYASDFANRQWRGDRGSRSRGAGLSSDSFRSQTGSDYGGTYAGSPQYTGPINGILKTSNNVAVYDSARTPTNEHDGFNPLGASILSLPDSSQYRQRGVPKKTLHRSMPKITHNDDFGIYGDDDDDDDDETIGESPYRPSAASEDAQTRKFQKLGISQRSKSHLDVANGSGSPSQQLINMSLAKSLAGEQPDRSHPNKPIRSRAVRPTSAKERPTSRVMEDEQRSQDELEKPKPKAERPKSIMLQSTNQPRPEIKVRENVWDESTMDANMLNTSVNPNSKKEQRRRNKEARLYDSMQEGDFNNSRMKGFKKSIKNIFFKKRGSTKVTELSTPITPVEYYSDKNYSDKSPSEGIPSPREQAPPKDNTVVVNNVVNHVDLNTFEDENGDPCSAV